MSGSSTPTLDDFMNQAYQAWTTIGSADSATILAQAQAAAFPTSTLQTTLSALEQVQDRCIISKVKAAFVRQLLGQT